MSRFNGLKLTKLGEKLLADVNGNLNETITFTKGEAGSGTISTEDEIRFLTALKEKWVDLKLTSIEQVGKEKTVVKLEFQFSNTELKEEKKFREIGIYAKSKNTDPILFAYTNAGEFYDYVPLPKDNPQTFIIAINLTVTSAKVEALVDNSAFITIEFFNSFKLDLDNKMNEKLDKANVSEEYDTAEKLENKIKEAKNSGDNAGIEANKKLDKGNVIEKYNTAEKIGNEIDKKFDKTGGTISGNVVVTENEVVNGSISCNSLILNGYTVTIE